MINLLLGAPGGGKSYEACVYHILEAVKKGRRVVTNLPLLMDAWAALDPTYPDLIELRRSALPIRGEWDVSKEDNAFSLFPDGHWMPPAKGARVFGGVWDYYDAWRHPDTGKGALFVIDECHLALPKGKTDQYVEEWYAQSRHFNADVLLLTQSYGKISAPIRDLVQIVYRVRKNVALGSTNSYTRKVQDGLRGEVVNTTIRSYKSAYFGLYRSHTQGGAAEESNASDVRPIWKHWTFIGAAICFVILVVLLGSGSVNAPWTVHAKSPAGPAGAASVAQSAASAVPRVAVAVAPVASAASSAPVEVASDPFAGRGLHLLGYLKAGKREVWTFIISQNGQGLNTITDADLRAAGYSWSGQSVCSGVLTYGKVTRSVICDAPQVAVFTKPEPPSKASSAGAV